MFSCNYSFSGNLSREKQLSVSKHYGILKPDLKHMILCMHRYVVDWGDGTSVTGHKIQLGPFQSVHQYHQQAATYVVTAKYCSDPDGKPEDRCCDSISQKISIPANSSVNVN